VRSRANDTEYAKGIFFYSDFFEKKSATLGKSSSRMLRMVPHILRIAFYLPYLVEAEAIMVLYTHKIPIQFLHMPP
jgi:hypothetical protein